MLQGLFLKSRGLLGACADGDGGRARGTQPRDRQPPTAALDDLPLVIIIRPKAINC